MSKKHWTQRLKEENEIFRNAYNELFEHYLLEREERLIAERNWNITFLASLLSVVGILILLLAG